MDSRSRFTDDDWEALAAGPAAAAAAMLATSRPGFFGAFKEVLAGAKAVEDLPPEAASVQLLVDLREHAGSHEEFADNLSKPDDDDDLEAVRTAALQQIDRAGKAARALGVEERDAYVAWVAGVAQKIAEAAADKGASDSVSPSEAQTLAELERRLRRG